MRKKPGDGYLDASDAAFIATVEDATLRQTMLCAVSTYRRPDRLTEGDPAPDVTLLRLEDGSEFRLEFPAPRPTVLIFGSYT